MLMNHYYFQVIKQPKQHYLYYEFSDESGDTTYIEWAINSVANCGESAFSWMIQIILIVLLHCILKLLIWDFIILVHF